MSETLRDDKAGLPGPDIFQESQHISSPNAKIATDHPFLAFRNLFTFVQHTILTMLM